MAKSKPILNLIVLGHVNAGKSTFIDSLVSNLNSINKQFVENKSMEIDKDLFKFHSILNKLKSNYECDYSIDNCLYKMETKNNSVRIIDVPGHCHFLKNLIGGSSQPNCVLLLISAVNEEFEISLSNNGLTFEHIDLAHLLGVEQIIICINKMDMTEPSYSEERYNQIKDQICKYMKKIGYEPLRRIFVPISSCSAENLINESDNTRWFMPWTINQKEKSVTGKTIYESLDAMIPTVRPTNKPLRLPLSDVYKIGGIGTVPVGRVETGTLKPNMIVKFTPSNLFSRVKSLEVGGAYNEAIPGDYTGFSVERINVKDLKRGFVCSDIKNDPAEEVNNFIGYIFILNYSEKISSGFSSTLFCHTTHVNCQIVEIIKKFDRRSGKTIEYNPKDIKSKEAALVKIILSEPICLEKYSDYPSLARFILKQNKQTIAVGIVKDLQKKTTYH